MIRYMGKKIPLHLRIRVILRTVWLAHFGDNTLQYDEDGIPSPSVREEARYDMFFMLQKENKKEAREYLFNVCWNMIATDEEKYNRAELENIDQRMHLNAR